MVRLTAVKAKIKEEREIAKEWAHDDKRLESHYKVDYWEDKMSKAERNGNEKDIEHYREKHEEAKQLRDKKMAEVVYEREKARTKELEERDKDFDRDRRNALRTVSKSLSADLNRSRGGMASPQGMGNRTLPANGFNARSNPLAAFPDFSAPN